MTQNFLSEVLADSTSEVNQTLPTMESFARVAQRSRAKASGSAQHMEAKTSVEFPLPSTCTSLSACHSAESLLLMNIILIAESLLLMNIIAWGPQVKFEVRRLAVVDADVLL